MANVMPTEIKKEVRAVIRARFMLLTSCIVLICAVIVFLMLLPSWFSIAHTPQSPDSKPISAAQQALDKTALAQTTALLTTLSPIALASTTPSQAVSAALAVRPIGISIEQITYTAGNPSTLILFGSAKTTSAISDYRTALASSTIFTSVQVPVGALVGAEGGQFTLTLTGPF
ncbi:MAG TPA: hypothetical protein VMU27_02425 [Candidatus Paceibacterota bacterium]|nr:hypothetical protein [Candidatus Paceibacterota bacterium]